MCGLLGRIVVAQQFGLDHVGVDMRVLNIYVSDLGMDMRVLNIY